MIVILAIISVVLIGTVLVVEIANKIPLIIDDERY